MCRYLTKYNKLLANHTQKDDQNKFSLRNTTYIKMKYRCIPT